MSLEILKEKCENSNRFKQLNKEQLKRYDLEIRLAKRYYNNGVDLEEEFNNKKPSNKNIIPYLLGITNNLELEEIEYKQIKEGAGSGGIDVDFDVENRDLLIPYLKEKYGEENVISVGTYSTLKLKAAIKDVLRVYKVDYKETNRFTKDLDSGLSFEENLNSVILTDSWNKQFYEKHKEKIEIALKLVGKIRGMSKHAGGVVITPKPVYNFIPVERVQGEIVSAYEESGQKSTLDELSIVKYDLLGISVLNTIKKTIEMIDEQLYLIEDDDGVQKIVGESYIQKSL